MRKKKKAKSKGETVMRGNVFYRMVRKHLLKEVTLDLT